MKGMNKALVLAAVVLGGCSLYEGDGDDEPMVDAGELQPMGGVYRVTWECVTEPCSNPIDDTVQAVVTDGSPTTIAWVRNGAPTAVVTHIGERTMTGRCVDVAAGTDFGVARDGYALCFDDTPGQLAGGVTYAGTFSGVTLTLE